MAHGPRFSPYVSRFIGPPLSIPRRSQTSCATRASVGCKGRATAVGIGAQLLVFCLDAEARRGLGPSLCDRRSKPCVAKASAECRNVKGNCVRGTPSQRPHLCSDS